MAQQQEVAPATPNKKPKAAAAAAGGSGSAKKKKKSGKKNQPGRYSQLVVDTIRKLGERNGSSLAKIYSEAKKVSWFDQQNGRTYLKYSVKALVQNDTLLQVKGVGANGSFRLNKKKLEGLAVPKRAPAVKKAASSTPKKSPKKAKPAAKKTSVKAATKSPKKKAASKRPVKKVKKAAKPKALKAKKA
ncbi:histone H1.10-like [Pseudophryne corroboree]|uniref:histone H1.10-like n=1 Tax=Pseudophryne corroboree TaxID=495146 RepID=UPI003082024E